MKFCSIFVFVFWNLTQANKWAIRIKQWSAPSGWANAKRKTGTNKTPKPMEQSQKRIRAGKGAQTVQGKNRRRPYHPIRYSN